MNNIYCANGYLAGKIITAEDGAKRKVLYLNGNQFIRITTKHPNGSILRTFIVDGQFAGPGKLFLKDRIMDFSHRDNLPRGYAIQKLSNGEILETDAIEDENPVWRKV